MAILQRKYSDPTKILRHSSHYHELMAECCCEDIGSSSSVSEESDGNSSSSSISNSNSESSEPYYPPSERVAFQACCTDDDKYDIYFRRELVIPKYRWDAMGSPDCIWFYPSGIGAFTTRCLYCDPITPATKAVNLNEIFYTMIGPAVHANCEATYPKDDCPACSACNDCSPTPDCLSVTVSGLQHDGAVWNRSYKMARQGLGCSWNVVLKLYPYYSSASFSLGEDGVSAQFSALDDTPGVCDVTTDLMLYTPSGDFCDFAGVASYTERDWTCYSYQEEPYDTEITVAISPCGP